MSWEITIYGSDTNYGEYPLQSALSGNESYTFTAQQINPQMIYVDDNIEGEGGALKSKNTLRIDYTIKVYPIGITDFPTSETKIEDFFFSDLRKKEFQYIYFNDYPLIPETIVDAVNPTCERIAIEDVTTTSNYENALKLIEIKCSHSNLS